LEYLVALHKLLKPRDSTNLSTPHKFCQGLSNWMDRGGLVHDDEQAELQLSV